jgi:hypothetical protein
MRAVEIRHRLPNGDVEVLARVSAASRGVPVVIEPTEHSNLGMIEDILGRAGVVNALGAPISRLAGDDYVRALPGSLRGSRLWAEDVSTADGPDRRS